MPQMFPLNWILLYMIFTIIFIIFNIMNYYNITLIKKINFKKKNIMKKTKLNWKW